MTVLPPPFYSRNEKHRRASLWVLEGGLRFRHAFSIKSSVFQRNRRIYQEFFCLAMLRASLRDHNDDDRFILKSTLNVHNSFWQIRTTNALSKLIEWQCDQRLSPVRTDGTLLANNSQHCWMLHVASVYTPCCMLLYVVVCCWAKFETGQTFQPTTPNISFVPRSLKRAQKCWIAVCTALPTLLGPRTLITHGLQRLMGFILPTMHCRSQHCWEFQFAHHCQHARNNSQHCCAIVASICTQP